jgi:glycerol kinase
MACFVAIDQSTSATKALLFAADGTLIDRESREHAQHYPQPGWVEHDAEEIWQNTLAVVRALLGRHPEKARTLAGVSLANQRETVIVFDRKTGRSLHRAIVWQCRRSEPLCEEHRAAGREALVRRKTGLTLDPYFSGSKLQWLVRRDPALAASLASGEALAGTIDAWLIFRLTGGRVFATDATNASRTLLFDLGRLDWDDELCAMFEVPRRALPEVRESTARFGETTFDGLLAAPVPICGVMGDSQAALFAHGCFEPGAAKITFGTGSSLLLNIGATPRAGANGVLTALAWVHRGAPVYAHEGIVISSASTLAWLRDQLRLVESLDNIESLARAVPDNGGVYLVPAFSGLGLPYWQPRARAAIVGLSAHSDRRHIVRAALESIAFQIRDALEAMRAAAGVPLLRVHCDGGPTANRFLMQFTADIAGTELLVAASPDGAALGALAAGRLGLGLVASLAELKPAAAPAVFRPAMSAADAARLCAGWRQAVNQVLLPAS